MHTSAFVVRVPHAQYSTFGVQAVAMRDSMMLWCGAVPNDTGKADAGAVAEADSATQSPTPAAPAGCLGRDWSVAMTSRAPDERIKSTGTYLYHADGEAGCPMAQRLGTLVSLTQRLPRASLSCTYRSTCHPHFVSEA